MSSLVSKVEVVSDTNHYSIVEIDVSNNTIYLTDKRDSESVAIDPDCWQLIKDTVDQQIQDGYLND